MKAFLEFLWRLLKAVKNWNLALRSTSLSQRCAVWPICSKERRKLETNWKWVSFANLSKICVLLWHIWRVKTVLILFFHPQMYTYALRDTNLYLHIWCANKCSHNLFKVWERTHVSFCQCPHKWFWQEDKYLFLNHSLKWLQVACLKAIFFLWAWCFCKSVLFFHRSNAMISVAHRFWIVSYVNVSNKSKQSMVHVLPLLLLKCYAMIKIIGWILRKCPAGSIGSLKILSTKNLSMIFFKAISI